MLIHVTLKFPFDSSDVARVISTANIRDINERRVTRFGIISGFTDDVDAYVKLKQLQAVQSIEIET